MQLANKLRRPTDSMKDYSTLRTGFSTGACATAVIRAAFISLFREQIVSEVTVLFPDTQKRLMQLHTCSKGYAEIIKDGGDDPDCTHGAHIYARISHCCMGDHDARDHSIAVGESNVYIRAVEGIGLVTREGLPCMQGKWAINPVPLEMIQKNIANTFTGREGALFLVELGVHNGDIIAKKTLNERLGIVGGISILGTTGLVRPYSHDAYAQSIEMQVVCAKGNGLDTLLFATGSRTASGAEKFLNDITAESNILIADFIGCALSLAEKHGIRKVFIACMPGKLLKYIAGYENTHAHRREQNLAPLEQVICTLFPEKNKNVPPAVSVREAVVGFSSKELCLIFTPLVHVAKSKLKIFAPSIALEILLFDFQGNLLVRSDMVHSKRVEV